MDFTFYWHDKGLNFCNGSLPIAATCMLHRQMYDAFSSRIESGLDQKNLSNLGHFIDASSGYYLQTKLFGCELDS